MKLTDEHFRLLVESIEDYAIYLLDADGVIRSWNPGAEKLKGYASHEVVGQSFAKFFSPADVAAGKPKELLAAARRTGHVEDVGWRLRKDGTQFWASAVLTRLRDANGNDVGFAKITRDLTDRSYRAFVEATHAIVWSTDGDGRPNADSPSWRAYTGQTEEEWRGLGGWTPVHPEDVDVLRTTWPTAKAERTRFSAQFRLRRHDGKYLWMEASALPFFDPAGNVREWFGVTFDISDRKDAELRAARAIQQWTTTLRSIGDAVISTDARGTVRFMNPIAEALTGWTADEAMGRALGEVFAIFNEETGAPVENPVDKVIREGVIVGLANHTVLRKRNGGELPIHDSAAPIRDPDGAIDGVVLVFRDASEEKRELMRRSYLGSATEALIDATDYRDALTRVAQLAVPRLADWASVTIAERGEPPQQLAVAHVDPAKVQYARDLGLRYPPDPSSPTGVPNVLRTGRSEFYPEIPRELLERGARDADHLRIINELDLRSALVVPLRGKGPVFGAITFVLAGSDRRYTERDLALAEDLARRAGLIIERRRLEEEAENANRMKDEFLATMSHELRTPLQAILGYASMLERGVARDPAKALETIMRNANAQTRLIEDILDISRITSGKLRLAMDEVDLVASVRSAIESVRPAVLARRLRLVENLPAEPVRVYGDHERLQQIVWNLLSNAVKFTEPDGSIELAVVRTGSAARIVVRDSGKGIPAAHLSTIFERFRQIDSSTTRQHGGLGLGLAIVRYLVEAHGGTVSAESAGPGHGSTFTVALPARIAVLEQVPVTTSPSPALEAGPLSGVRVLLVDDDEDARELVGDVLQHAGAIVIRAASAAEAYAAVQSEAPQVLVSDIGMPFEDGYSLIRRIRELAPERGGDVAAIALTAYARPEDVQTAERAGFQLHVVKPVRTDELIESIRSCVPAVRRSTS